MPTILFCDISVMNRVINNGSIDEDELLIGIAGKPARADK
jgi:hypothetical protein